MKCQECLVGSFRMEKALEIILIQLDFPRLLVISVKLLNNSFWATLTRYVGLFSTNLPLSQTRLQEFLASGLDSP